MDNKFIHLTNSSIQKHNAAEIAADNPLRGAERDAENEDVGGSKISFLGGNGLWALLRRLHGIDCDALWRSVCLLIVKSLVVVDDKMSAQPCSFELFGYDVLVDAALRPWLIEVNASPSLAGENALDHRVKNAMLRDKANLFDCSALVRVIHQEAPRADREEPGRGREERRRDAHFHFLKWTRDVEGLQSLITATKPSPAQITTKNT